MTADLIPAGAMKPDSRIYVAGHAGLVGSAIVRRLEASGHTNLLTATRQQLDLRDQAEVSHWFKANRPEHVFLVAGTVGGIMANSTRPAEFIYDNLMIHGTVVHAAHQYDVAKLLYLGSSCIYPRHATQPITEDELLTGPLEPTNEWYAIAKIAGIKLCQAKIAGIKLCQAYRQQYGRDFIKIDTQGWEINVLEGMQGCLHQNPKLVILFEFWPGGLRHAGRQPADLLAMLFELGFAVTTIEGSSVLPANVAAMVRRMGSKGYTDLIATRPVGSE